MTRGATDESECLNAFDDALAALARGLDVPQVFRQLMGAAARLLPLDEAYLALANEDARQWRIYASTREASQTVCAEEAASLLEAAEPRLVDRVGTRQAARGLQSGLTVPVRINDQLFGVFALLSRRPRAYSHRDLAEAQRLARYLALALSHQRLVHVVRQIAQVRTRADGLEARVQQLSDELASKGRSPADGGPMLAPQVGPRILNQPWQDTATNLEVLERDTIARVLRETRWNKSKAARRLGLSRTQLYGRMRKYGLKDLLVD